MTKPLTGADLTRFFDHIIKDRDGSLPWRGRRDHVLDVAWENLMMVHGIRARDNLDDHWHMDLTPNTFGRTYMRVGGKLLLTYRLALATYLQHAMPWSGNEEDEETHHLCGDETCVRPDHLLNLTDIEHRQVHILLRNPAALPSNDGLIRISDRLTVYEPRPWSNSVAVD